MPASTTETRRDPHSAAGGTTPEVGRADSTGVGRFAAIGLTTLLLAALLLLLPAENWASGRIAATLGHPDGSWVRLASLATATALTTLAVWLLAGRPRVPQRRVFGTVTLLFVISGTIPVATSIVTGGILSLAVREAWLGHIAPAIIVMGILTLPPLVARRLWVAFFAGWCLYLLVALLAVAGSTPSDGWRALGPSARLVMWKFEMLDTSLLFTRWVGNSNKASNVLLLGLLLAPAFMGLRRSMFIGDAVSDDRRGTDPVRLVAAVYFVLATLLMVLLYSRACLFLLPIAVVAGGWWSVFRKRSSRIALAGYVAMLTAIMVGLPTTRNALFFGSYPTGESQGFLSTYTMEGGRFDQAQDVLGGLAEESNWLFGVGSGQYGMQTSGSADAGTHNYLLDIWLAGGILSFVLSLLWICICATYSGLRWREPSGRLGIVAIFMLLLLMSREYSAAYLGALSMGGIFIMLVIATTTGALRTPARSHAPPTSPTP